MDATVAREVELIPERDVTVLRDPTDVWLLTPDEDGTFKQYEQWEKMRRIKVRAICQVTEKDVFYLKNSDDHFGVRVDDTDFPLDADAELDMAPERPGERYRVGIDETLYDVARKFKLSPTVLMNHNEITDPKKVRPGSWLYIPKREKKERLAIEYRVLAEPRPMHVNHPAYTTKYVFGNVRKWGDIKADKDKYKDGQNVDIYAVAKVPVEGTIAAYYMDKHDFGQFLTNGGRPAYTRGFNWQHLAEGHIAPASKKVTPEMVTAIADEFDDRPEPTPEVIEVEPETVPESPTQPLIPEVEEVPEPTVSPIERELDAWKSSFQYLNLEESPELYQILQDMDIREFDGQSEPIHKEEGKTVKVIGWFTHQGTPYYRVATRYWFGIPTHMAYSIEDDVFNEGLPKTTAERVLSGGYLSDSERRLAWIAKNSTKPAAAAGKIRSTIAKIRRK